jgi:CDP-glucose 4,6-dehydratase
MTAFGDVYRGRTVFLTGHTGFKGAWLAEWLLALGARVIGYALPPPTDPAVFTQLGLARRLDRHILADINDLSALRDAIIEAQPDFVFHLAAQPLVRESYRAPVETFATNVLGTAHVLESLRALEKPCAAVIVTTDKCYENREWLHGYRESDPLGGRDPYSASKAAAEIVTASFRASFFGEGKVRIATARAGNVIGGGDWAADRIVPDCIRALTAGKPIDVRNPGAVRPWQHVLEPLAGYLWLAARLTHDAALATAFNFGPGHDANRTVGELASEVLKHWPGRWRDRSDPHAPHEAKLLQLSTDKTHAQLGWAPAWTFSDAVRETVRWYRTPMKRKFTTQQIRAYTATAKKRGLPWAQ